MGGIIVIRVAICDDAPYELEKIRQLAQAILKERRTEAQITTWTSLLELQDQIFNGQFDLLLLDIRFEAEKQTSLELAQKCSVIAPELQIIFITGYLQYFPDVYLCQHVYCLLKEDLERRLPLAMIKALNVLQGRQIGQDSLTVMINRHPRLILYQDILYLEKDRRKIIFNCRMTKAGSQKSDSLESTMQIITYAVFDDYLPKLPQSFVQTHRSYIANLNYVKSVETKGLILFNDAFIPISRSYKKATMNAIMKQFFDIESAE